MDFSANKRRSFIDKNGDLAKTLWNLDFNLTVVHDQKQGRASLLLLRCTCALAFVYFRLPWVDSKLQHLCWLRTWAIFGPLWWVQGHVASLLYLILSRRAFRQDGIPANFAAKSFDQFSGVGMQGIHLATRLDAPKSIHRVIINIPFESLLELPQLGIFWSGYNNPQNSINIDVVIHLLKPIIDVQQFKSCDRPALAWTCHLGVVTRWARWEVRWLLPKVVKHDKPIGKVDLHRISASGPLFLWLVKKSTWKSCGASAVFGGIRYWINKASATKLGMNSSSYPLVICYTLLLKKAVEMIDLAIEISTICYVKVELYHKLDH